MRVLKTDGLWKLKLQFDHRHHLHGGIFLPELHRIFSLLGFLVCFWPFTFGPVCMSALSWYEWMFNSFRAASSKGTSDTLVVDLMVEPVKIARPGSHIQQTSILHGAHNIQLQPLTQCSWICSCCSSSWNAIHCSLQLRMFASMMSWAPFRSVLQFKVSCYPCGFLNCFIVFINCTMTTLVNALNVLAVNPWWPRCW